MESYNGEPLKIELIIHDPVVVKYLMKFEGEEREIKAFDALKVGVIAIQSASPSLDARIVEEKFREVEKSIGDQLTQFKGDVKTNFEEYFKTESGLVPRSLDKLFGKEGQLGTLFGQYFNSNDGRVSRLIQEHIGPASAFAKSMDPANRESVVCKIQEAVKTHLEEKVSEIVNEFSLDVETSALARLKAELAKEVRDIKDANNKFFVELKEALGMKAAKELEAEKGTEKGRDFETALYDCVAEIGRQLGDTTENVRSIVGAVPRSKKGDYVSTLGSTSGAPGSRIVIEAKKEQGYKLKDAIDELKEAKANREAGVGIFVFAKGYEPPEVGDFHFIGNDFFVTVDGEAMEKGQSILFFDAAYKIVRALIVTSARKSDSHEVDLEQIQREASSLAEHVSRLADLITKAKTISTNSKTIEEVIGTLKIDMEARLEKIATLAGKVKE